MRAALIWRHKLLLPDLYPALGDLSCLGGGGLSPYTVVLSPLFWESAGVCVTEHDVRLPNRDMILLHRLRPRGAIRWHDSDANLSTCCFKFNVGVEVLL